MRRLTPYVLSILTLAPLAPSVADIVINEIHYSPSPNNEAVEYVELYNNGPDTTDLSSWKFTDGFSYTFPESSALASGAYL
ncbi:lamin tail domain-containing protein, partial [bacterium]|nr:lamin tail domain-containing protein [bacterium]